MVTILSLPGGQIICDSKEEADALKWMAVVSPFSIEDIYSLWSYFKKKFPSYTWEQLLERTAFVLYNCSKTGRSVHVVLELMMRYEEYNLWGKLDL